MNTVDEPGRPRTDSFALDFDLPHPPEKVWRALTDPALLSEWVLPVVGFELAPGAAFRFETQPMPGWDGVVSCKILEIEEHRKLSYAWTVPFLDTVVTFTLAPAGKGTRLQIRQSGFKPDQKQAFGGARYGWKMMGGRLVDLLARLA
jgi:uncharacterized protein YndB with AHSA1/START domain